MRLLALALLALPLPAAAQVAASAAAQAPDPARVAAATRLIDVVMPAARRDTMLTAMMGVMTRNMVASMRGDATMAAMFDRDPRAQAAFERYMTRVQSSQVERLREALPAMVTAMARAYARRFTVAQMAEMQAFFATPTGQLYMEQGSTIMSDPDVAAWQQSIMARTMAELPTMVRELTAEIIALPDTKK